MCVQKPDSSVRMSPSRSRDELGPLGEAFKRMSAKVSRSHAMRRQIAADTADELRTPIHIMLGHADAVHEGVLPASQETFEAILGEALRGDPSPRGHG